MWWDTKFNYVIEEKLKSMGIEIVDYSHFGKEIQDFEKQISEDLFSFLIENNMHRYTFGVFLRHGSLDVNDFSFGFKHFNSNKVKEIAKESFIKKKECSGCKVTIFRSHLNEINFKKTEVKSCFKCDTINEFEYSDLEDDFEINRNDLIKFLERLNDLNVISKEPKLICPKCKNKTDIEEDNLSLLCPRCENQAEIKFIYVFNNEFLKNVLKFRDGKWFEWYVYMLSSYIYENSDHNLLIKFENEGITKQCEIDVISVDKKGDLLVFECKDNLFKDTSFGDMENIARLSLIFDKIYFVGSNKIKKRSIKSIQELCRKKISFIEGTELEKKYASGERVLELFLTEPTYKAIRLFEKLSNIKKKYVIDEIILKIIESNSKDDHLLNVLSEIIDEESKIKEIAEDKIEDFKKIASQCVNNIDNSHLVSDSIYFIQKFIIHFSPTPILGLFDYNKLISIGAPYLSENSFIGSDERRPFFYFYSELFNTVTLEKNQVDEKILQEFFNKFIKMIDIYYGYDNRRNTLSIINRHWDLLNSDNKNKFGEVISSIVNYPKLSKWNIGIFGDEIEKHFNEFNESIKKNIKIGLAAIISQGGEGHKYISTVLSKL